MNFGNPFNKPALAPKPTESKRGCRIKVKKHSDGSTTKEISGNCSKEELRALTSGEIDADRDF